MRVYPGLEIIDTPFEGTRQINVALFTGGRHALVDTGVAGCPTATILPALEERGIGAVDLHLVINLHAHADHIGGNGEVFTASGELTTLPPTPPTRRPSRTTTPWRRASTAYRTRSASAPCWPAAAPMCRCSASCRMGTRSTSRG